MFNKIFKLDGILLWSVFFIAALGLAALYSLSLIQDNASTDIFRRQLIFIGIGIVVAIFFAGLNYQSLRGRSTPIYFITLLILILVLLFGKKIRGTVGWIGIGPLHFQPVEMAKLALIIFLASFISQKKSLLGEPVRLVASFVLTAIMIFFVMKQPDMGSSIVLLGIWIGMMLVSGINKKHFLILLLAGIMIAGSSWFFLADYQKNRIMNVFRPENDPRGSGYNVIQSIVAVGSGKVFGKGIGYGSQSQLNFLPEKHTDFIFAVMVEELGAIGGWIVIFLYALFFYRIKKIALNAYDNFGYLLSVGIMVMFALQIFINIGMNVGIIPVTGITLPFLSYGGSSLVVSFAALGILLNIHAKQRKTLVSHLHLD